MLVAFHFPIHFRIDLPSPSDFPSGFSSGDFEATAGRILWVPCPINLPGKPIRNRTEVIPFFILFQLRLISVFFLLSDIAIVFVVDFKLGQQRDRKAILKFGLQINDQWVWGILEEGVSELGWQNRSLTIAFSIIVSNGMVK